MNNKITYRYSLIAFLAIAGLIGSLTHYHSEGLECLDHAEEQHFVQNEILCPICTLMVSGDFEANLLSEAYLFGEEYSSFYVDNSSDIDTFLSRFGRAPPIMS